MKHTVLALAAVLALSVPASGEPPKPSTNFDDVKALVAAAGKIEKVDVVLREGLPHPFNEPKQFQAEKKKENIESAGQLFYKGDLSVKADDSAKLTGLLRDAATYTAFRGEKKCGGFHPDYEVVIVNTADKSEYRFQICFGCHEVKVYGPGDKAVRADIKKEGYDALTKLLKPYRKNRPEPRGG
jgi:hypothetical protein